jgi:hypothetical protein
MDDDRTVCSYWAMLSDDFGVTHQEGDDFVQVGNAFEHVVLEHCRELMLD